MAARGARCHVIEVVIVSSKKHPPIKPGQSRAYASWYGMLARCRNPNNVAYEVYGGRAITVAPEWESFEQFFLDMGVRPEGTTLDRIENSLGYFKNNCRWTTPIQQANNRRPRKPRSPKPAAAQGEHHA
jgi:hypothetical protein